jgi:hypothetical protein
MKKPPSLSKSAIALAKAASAASQSCSTANNIVSESDLVEATGRLHAHLAKQPQESSVAVLKSA